MKLRLFGLPLHPLLVHFPIAFWIVVPVLDTAALAAGPEPWWTLAFAATLLGLVTGAAAIAVGLLEYIQPSLVHRFHETYRMQGIHISNEAS